MWESHSCSNKCWCSQPHWWPSVIHTWSSKGVEVCWHCHRPLRGCELSHRVSKLTISSWTASSYLFEKGSPVILLHNMDPSQLCNSTCLCIKQMLRHVIEATILTGCAKGENAFIPCILFMPSDTVKFQKTATSSQIVLCYVHQQSLGTVSNGGRCNKCFSHGQLYVACSRVGSPSNLHIQAPGGKTESVQSGSGELIGFRLAGVEEEISVGSLMTSLADADYRCQNCAMMLQTAKVYTTGCAQTPFTSFTFRFLPWRNLNFAYFFAWQFAWQLKLSVEKKRIKICWHLAKLHQNVWALPKKILERISAGNSPTAIT